VKAFITPGGHRRYSSDELLKLTGYRGGHGIKELVEKMELTLLLDKDDIDFWRGSGIIGDMPGKILPRKPMRISPRGEGGGGSMSGIDV